MDECMYVCLCMCVCVGVCVCERERKRQGEKLMTENKADEKK